MQIFVKNLLGKLENEVSVDQEDQEPHFPISLEETYVCTSQIIKPKFFTFSLTEPLICLYLQKELNLKAYTLY